MDKGVVGQSHLEGSGQCLRILMDIGDKWCSSGLHIGTSVI